LKKMKEINVSLNSPISYFGVKTGKVLEWKVVDIIDDIEVTDDKDFKVVFKPKVGLSFFIKLSSLEAGIQRAKKNTYPWLYAPRSYDWSKEKKSTKVRFDWRVKWWDWEKIITR
jgi:hypothetical protein